MSKAASQYLREVKKRIHCSSSQKTEFLCQLEDEIFLFCENRINVEFADLSEHFGAPEEVAENFLSEFGANEVNKCNRIKRRVLYVCSAIIITAAVIISAVEIYTYYTQQKFEDSFFIESITYKETTNPYATAPTGWIVEFESNEDNEFNSTAPNK